MEYSIISAAILLILIMDPFGNIPLFASTLKNITDQRRKYTIIVREHIIAFALTIAIVTSLVVLLTATATHKLIGERILVAIERLMGLILVAVSIEMFVKGVKGVL